MSSALGRLAASIALDVSDFTVGTKQAQADAAAFATSVTRTFSDMERGAKAAVTNIAGALGLGLSIDYFKNLVEGSIDAQEHLENLSKSTGLAASQLAGFRLVAAAGGTNIDSMAMAIDRMTVNMGKAPEKFAALGVTSKDSAIALGQLSDIFNSLTDIQQRNALAQAVFNRSWAEVAPVLSMGSAKIADLTEQGKELSASTDEMAKNAAKFNEQTAILTTTLGAAKTKIVGDMLPALNDIVAATIEAAKEGGILTAVWVAMGGVAANIWARSDVSEAQAKLATLQKEMVSYQNLINDAMERGYDPAYALTAQGQIRYDNLKGELRLQQELITAMQGGYGDSVSRAQTNATTKPSPFDSGASARAAAFLGAQGATAASDPGLDLLTRLEEEAAKLNQQITGQLGNQTLINTQLELQKGKYKDLDPITQAFILFSAAVVDSEKQQLQTLQFINAEHQKELDFAAASGDALVKLVNDAQDAADAAEREVGYLGMSNDQRQKAVLLEKLREDILAAHNDPAAVRDLTNAYMQNVAAIDQIVKAQSRLNVWTDLSAKAGQFFGDLVVNGKSAFDNLRNMVKQLAQDLIALFAQRFILQIAAGVTGSAALGNAAASVGANTVSGGLLSSIGSGLGSTAIGGALSSQVAGFTTAFGTAADVTGMGAMAAGTGMTAAGAGTLGSAIGTALAAIPVWGWIALAVGALVAMSQKPGGPKSGGSFNAAFDASGNMLGNVAVPGADNGRFYTPNGLDSSVATVGQTAASSYYNLANALGVKGNALNFGLGFDTDPNGTAPNRVSGLLTDASGKVIYQDTNRDIGRDSSQISPELQLEASREVLAALKSSDLPDYLQKVFDGLTPSTATQDQITAAEQQALALQSIFGVITKNPMQDVATAIAASSNQFQTALKNNATALQTVARAYDGSLTATQNLATATTTYYNAQIQLLAGISQVKQSIDDMFGATFQNIKLAGLDNQSKYNFYQSDAQTAEQLAVNSSDPATIQALATRVNNDINAAFNLLSPDQQAGAQGQAFITQGTTAQQTVDARLAKIQKDAADATQKTLDQIKDILTANNDVATAAANKQDGAADKQVNAANTPIKIILLNGAGQQVSSFG